MATKMIVITLQKYFFIHSILHISYSEKVLKSTLYAECSEITELHISQF